MQRVWPKSRIWVLTNGRKTLATIFAIIVAEIQGRKHKNDCQQTIDQPSREIDGAQSGEHLLFLEYPDVVYAGTVPDKSAVGEANTINRAINYEI